MIELELPYPPSVNNYKRVGRTVTTKNGKSYQQRVNTDQTKLFYYEVWLVIKKLKALKTISMPIQDEISVEVSLYAPDTRKRDIDNPIKALLDGLVKGGLLQDDSQISRLSIERCGIIDKGKVIIRIKAYE